MKILFPERGLTDASIELADQKSAQDLMNFIPRPGPVGEVRKGFKFYKSIPTTIETNNHPLRIWSLNRFRSFINPDNDWSMLLGVSRLPLVFEFGDGSPATLSDYIPTPLSSLVRDGQGVQTQYATDRQDFPSPVATEYTDINGSKLLVFASKRSNYNPPLPEGVPADLYPPIDYIWFIRTRYEADRSGRNSINAIAVPTVKVHQSGQFGGNDETFYDKSTSDFSYVINYNNRLFFMEEGTSNVWISREVNITPNTNMVLDLFKLPFTNGQNLFMCKPSKDVVQGPESWLAFVSDEGQVLLYPDFDTTNNYANLKFSGDIDIGRPLGGVNSHMEISGDVLVATERGLISIRAASLQDVATDQANVAAPIKNIWRDLIEESTGDWWVQRDTNLDQIMCVTPGNLNKTLIWTLDSKAFAFIDRPIQSIARYADKVLYVSGNDIYTYEGAEDTFYDDKSQQIEAKWTSSALPNQENTELRTNRASIRYTATNQIACNIEAVDFDFDDIGGNSFEQALQPDDYTKRPTPYFEGNDTVRSGSLVGFVTRMSIKQQQHPKLRISSLDVTGMFGNQKTGASKQPKGA